MSGEVKLGEADYTVFWERLLYMSNILERPFDAFSLVKAFCCWKMRKKFAKNPIWRLWIKAELILINMLSPTFVPYLVTLAWKMSSGMPKEAGSLNGTLCTYLMRRTSMIELIWDLWAINVLTKFENDPWKIMDVRVLTVIFHVRSWKMRKKIRQNFFLATMKKPGTYIDYHV